MTSLSMDKYPKNPENSRIQLDPRDANTPDKWIERHPELIRLTGTYLRIAGVFANSTLPHLHCGALKANP